ncbi:MAG: BMP family ABC transporter substrate-binding protein [Lachnospiraceae bacterium]|nr:BMP family ABC transporter substrate-binding protein [Lachnospiraceae bacterium]
MKRVNVLSFVTAVIFFLVVTVVHLLLLRGGRDERALRVGFVYDGDESTPYTANFIRAQEQIESELGERIVTIVKANVKEERIQDALDELAEQQVDMIFTTSYGYGEKAKEFAEKHPNVQVCQATCANANTDPVLKNYHTFMGEIYEGRYIAGVVAGMKLSELIQKGELERDSIKIGYVGAYPYAEVISGYTAFLLGIRSIVPEAKMYVKYADSWSAYNVEKQLAQELIDEGCVVISQHSDTIGPAVACEEGSKEQIVFHVGYNQSMIDVAPTTSLISTRINWTPYIEGAIKAVIAGKQIEDQVKGHVHGNDIGAGFEKDWVQMMELNEHIAAPGTQNQIDKLTRQFATTGKTVFQGPYTGTNPYDPSDTINLEDGFEENKEASAPSFGYVLDDVITVEN